MRLPITLLALLLCSLAPAHALQSQPVDPCLAAFHPVPAPRTSRLLLKPGDRLAICGDSITEQKMYSRLLEDYLTMCVPDLHVTVRQFGWSGERAAGFLARMTNDCLRFHPTIATTCYGMNDHEYRPYEERIGRTYCDQSAAILEAFKANGVRVVQGSPGCVGKMPSWVKTASGTVQDLNLSLCTLRNLGIELAGQEKSGFADVFWPMYTAGVAAQAVYGTNYAIAGRDGVHPGWAGHTIMAYAFLKAFGLEGELGTFTVDLKRNRLKSSPGHEGIATAPGEFQIKSSRYPFCACVPGQTATPPYPACDSDDLAKDSSIRSAMTLIPFNHDLNRLMLRVKGIATRSCEVTWGSQSKMFSAAELAHGINLAEEFPSNPFCEAFARVDAAVAAKQAFETTQIKKLFHSRDARVHMDEIVAQSESQRAPLAAAIQAAFTPVQHTLRLTPR